MGITCDVIYLIIFFFIRKSKKDDNKKDSHENLEEDHGIEMQKFLDVHHWVYIESIN